MNTANNPYGGYSAGQSAMLMERWPASVLKESKSSPTGAGLPTDVAVPYLGILVPSCPGVVLSPGDVITDDLARMAVITEAELTSMGWRLTAKMATT